VQILTSAGFCCERYKAAIPACYLTSPVGIGLAGYCRLEGNGSADMKEINEKIGSKSMVKFYLSVGLL
jgi:hypothetical protein